MLARVPSTAEAVGVPAPARHGSRNSGDYLSTCGRDVGEPDRLEAQDPVPVRHERDRARLHAAVHGRLQRGEEGAVTDA
jgi:hypothetical protein